MMEVVETEIWPAAVAMMTIASGETFTGRSRAAKRASFGGRVEGGASSLELSDKAASCPGAETPRLREDWQTSTLKQTQLHAK